MNKQTTTITFRPEHLAVIQKALEAYSRAKMGQFKYWLEETFGWQYDWDTGADIEKFIRLRMIEQHLEKKHGDAVVANRREDHFFGLKDTMNPTNFLRHYADFINTFARTEDEPFPRETNASWGILQTERVGDGQLAYEIKQTIRQYVAVGQNGGLFDHYTSTRDPLNYSGVPLPEIHGFEKYKDYRFNKTDSKKLHKLCQKKDWEGAFKFIDSIKEKYEIKRGDSQKIMWESSHCDVSGLDFPIETSYFLRVDKPRVQEGI